MTDKKNAELIFLGAAVMSAYVTQAAAMNIPEARVWGRADDGWNVFDSNTQISSTNSLSYAYFGALAGYSNHAYGGNTQSLAASAYGTTDGVTPNVNIGAIAVPYLYFQWRIVPNNGGSYNPLDMVPVDLSLSYAISSITAGVGVIESNAFFNDDVFGLILFSLFETPVGTYTFHKDSYIYDWNTVYMQLSASAHSGNTGGVGQIDALFSSALSLPSNDSALSLPSNWNSKYHIEYDIVGAPGPSPVPEPSNFLLLGVGLGGIAMLRKKGKKGSVRPGKAACSSG